MLTKRKKVLYFIKGRKPTDEQLERAIKHGASFRNATLVRPEDPVEQCDNVMGYVPAQYKKAKIPVISVKEEAPVKDEGGGTKNPPASGGTKPPAGGTTTQTPEKGESK